MKKQREAYESERGGKLFTATIRASQLESAVDLPGFEFAGQPYKGPCSWYPFTDLFRKIHFHAKHRRAAAKACESACLLVRDLNDGKTLFCK